MPPDAILYKPLYGLCSVTHHCREKATPTQAAPKRRLFHLEEPKMYSLQATLREITVLDLPVTEITVEVVDLPLYLDISENEVDDQLPPPPEVIYLDLDLSPAQLGLHVTHL